MSEGAGENERLCDRKERPAAYARSKANGER